LIQSYFEKVERKLEEIRVLVRTETTEFSIISSDMGIIKGRIVFIDGSVIDFRELVSEGEANYRFHYMDKDNRLIKRWDTAPHHRELTTFPFNLHTSDGVRECRKVTLINVLDQIKGKLIKIMSK